MLLSALLLAIAPKTIIFIILVLVLFFGAKRIPELFRGVGQGVKEFKNATREPQPEFQDRPGTPTAPGPGQPTSNPNQPVA
jgi:sec-independent protein translocase protein TatA